MFHPYTLGCVELRVFLDVHSYEVSGYYVIFVGTHMCLSRLVARLKRPYRKKEISARARATRERMKRREEEQERESKLEVHVQVAVWGWRH